ncbi:hypothetical protein E8E14_001380 [Neopestalotiopsis sp. 37M]|nr:hypothetical protein E8E14_001380 [Neopestalotiopsis sp. 37M]
MATAMTSTQLPLQRPLSILRSGELAFRQRFKKTDPSHSNCFGDGCFSISTGLGKITGWRIIGELQATAVRLQNTLLRLINEKGPCWQNCRPKHDPRPFYEPTYSLETFLIGPDQSHAAPRLTIVTPEEWVATRLKTIITESRILRNFPNWGCFKLPANITPTSPDISLMGLSGDESLDNDGGGYEVCIPGDKIPAHLDGVLVEIWKGDHYIGTATIGGFLSVGEQVLALSVAHVFYPRQPMPLEPFEFDESELESLLSDGIGSDDDSDLDQDFDQSFDQEINLPDTHAGRITSRGRAVTRMDQQIPLPSSFRIKTTIGSLERISRVPGPNNSASISLDWALIAITHPSIVVGNKIHRQDKRTNVKSGRNTVEILTYSATIIADIVSNAIFGLPLDAIPQPVLVANTGSTSAGDSGSWVFSMDMREPVGMLIGNSQTIKQCYILSMDEIISDIEVQTGLEAKIAPIKLFSHLEQWSFQRFVDDQRCSGIDESGNEAYYITASKLREYWSRERVSSLLNDFGQGEGLDFGTFSKDYLRLFSTLMYINEPEQFHWFVRRSINDSQLPYERKDGPHSHTMRSLFDLFEENQWMFCPLEFDIPRMSSETVHPRTVLPVTYQEMLSSLGQGENDGICSRVRINKDCNISMPNNTFVFKVYDLSDTYQLEATGLRDDVPQHHSRVRRSGRESWSYEIKAFEALRRRGGSEYIIQYYGSFSQGTKGIIILEDTSGMPLVDFLRQVPPPNNPVDILQLWEGLFDLMKGLERVHNLPEAQQAPLWCSLDMLSFSNSYQCWPSKPMIMVFVSTTGRRQRFFFKLAYVGLSTTCWKCQESQIQLSANLGASTTRPDILPQRRQYDIWALGCVFIEFLVWLTVGEHAASVHEAYWSLCNSTPVLQIPDSTKLASLHEALTTHRNTDPITQVISGFVFKHMLSNHEQTSESARQLYRSFHDTVLPAAENDESGYSRTRTASVDVPVLDIPAQSVTWETRSQRSTTSRTSSSKQSILDSGFFSGTSASSAASKWNFSDVDSAFFDDISVSSSSSREDDFLGFLAKDPDQACLSESGEPMFTVGDVNEWVTGLAESATTSTMSHQKSHQIAKAIKPRLNRKKAEELIQRLRGRDQLFVIDDSASMKAHWTDVTATFTALESILKIVEPEGDSMDLYFTSDPVIGYHSKKNERLVGTFGTVPVCGIPTMRSSLETLTDRIITRNIGIAGQNPNFKGGSGRPISIYIFTDGVWSSSLESHETALSGVDQAIRRLISEMERTNRPNTFVSVQFIRFGNSDVGVQHLKSLDDTLGKPAEDLRRGQERNNICDVTSHQGSVWRMLLGSLGWKRPKDKEIDMGQW